MQRATGGIRRGAARAHHRPPRQALRRARQDRRLPGRRRTPRPSRVLRVARIERPRARSADVRRYDLPHLFDEQADHLGRAHAALRARHVPTQRPDTPRDPRLAGSSGLRRGRRRTHRDPSGRTAHNVPEHSQSHRGAFLRRLGPPRGQGLPGVACPPGRRNAAQFRGQARKHTTALQSRRALVVFLRDGCVRLSGGGAVRHAP